MVSRKSAVKNIPIARPSFDKKEKMLVTKVIASGWIAQGRMVAEFEDSIAGYTGAEYCVAVSSGTAALHLALIASGVGPGDEVIVPSFSFIATANSVLYCGARPVFIDIDNRTYNIDPLKIEDFIENSCRFYASRKLLINKRTGSRVKAMMPVHQFGLPCNLDAIERIAKKHSLALVEDAACGLGSLYKTRRIGDGRNIACFSFHPRKIITTGEGGMVLTNDRLLAEKLRILRNHGAGFTAMDKGKDSKVSTEDYGELGYNYRLTDMQAAIGIGQMSRLPGILRKRRRLAKRYDNAFKGAASLGIPYIPSYATPNYQSYVVEICERFSARRDKIVMELLKYGISTRRGNTAIHMQNLYKSIGLDAALPNTEKAALNTIALPLYDGMREADQNIVIDRLLAIVRR